MASTDSDFSELAREIESCGTAAYAIGNPNAGPRDRGLWRRYFELRFVPTVASFVDAVRDFQRHDPTARDVRVPVANVRSALFSLRTNVVAPDYGYARFEALLAAAGLSVQGKGQRATAHRPDLTGD